MVTSLPCICALSTEFSSRILPSPCHFAFRAALPGMRPVISCDVSLPSRLYVLFCEGIGCSPPEKLASTVNVLASCVTTHVWCTLAIRPCNPWLFALSSDQAPAKFAGAAAFTDQKATIKTQHKLRN